MPPRFVIESPRGEMTPSLAFVASLAESLLSFALGVLVAFGAIRLFARLTRDMDEVAEIRNDNVAVAVVLVSMVVRTGLVTRAAICPAIGALQSALCLETGPSAVVGVRVRAVVYVAVEIVLGGFILVMGLFLARGVDSLLAATVPDPVDGRSRSRVSGGEGGPVRPAGVPDRVGPRGLRRCGKA